MKKSTIFQGSMREPGSDEEWEQWSVEQKDKTINRMSWIIIFQGAIIIWLLYRG